MGACLKACSDVFRELPEEQQQHWREIVTAERLAAMEEQEEIRSKMGEHLLPAQAQKMLDRVPGLLGPICEIVSDMTMTNITILFSGPEPLNYGLSKDEPCQKFSGNTERFNRCMCAFGEFVGECFDEADEDSRALSSVTPDPEDGKSSVLRRAITYRREIDHNDPVEGEEVDVVDDKPGEEAEEVLKSKKKRVGGKKRKSTDDDEESGEKESGKKKKKKKNGKEVPVFAESARGCRKKDALPATSMNTHQALEQISNTLAKVMPPAGPVISTPPDAEVDTVSSKPTDPQALQVVIAMPVSAIPDVPVSGSESPDKKGLSSELRMVIDPALLNWMQPQANLGESSEEPGTTKGADSLSSMGVEALAPAGTDGDVSWLYKYVPVTGPNDMPNPFAVSGTVIGHVPPQAPSPTLPQASAAPSFADAALLDGSKWKDWFRKARTYLDMFELDEEWSYMIAWFTLLEGRHGFKFGTSMLPNYKIWPEEVAWWSG
ncbi:uncharacterized protein ARMOST_21900 [Armillaria ostoyae]|uniref:Uncharacterized protein n=1 Tax=Armillaria ostoyae TaxID=47428 RepID=A0A284SBD0_ARMOS|nr:uncharacterized protein ARMOST_21900 [Armillaria ostoyae]